MNPSWLSAADTIDMALAASADRPITVVVDSAVAGSPVHERIEGWLRQRGPRPSPLVRRVLEPIGPDLDDALPPAQDSALTVAVGGGAVIDAVKVATLRAARVVPWPASRSGLLVPPRGAARAVPLVAIPTTLGTGAEASAVAVATRGDRRLLVMDRGLRPQAFAHSVEAFHTLPHQLVREGLAEILSRLLGPVIGDRVGEPLTDALCFAALSRLIGGAHRIVSALDTGQAAPDTDLLEVARIGALAHSDHFQRPHQPWAVRLWAIANELAAMRAAAKIPTTAMLWPAFWEAVSDGTDALGHPGRLAAVWQVITDIHPRPLPDQPGPGIAQLLEQWGVATAEAASADEASAAVDRVVSAWGGGLPMFHDVGSRDIRTVLIRSRHPHPTRVARSTSARPLARPLP